MQQLVCTVQAYAWGDPEAIPELLGQAPTGEPQAEMWMGAHPKAPSLLADGNEPLDTAIDANPNGLLGQEVSERFGRLPFLAKILAAGKPLSIQSHPSLAQAQQGFARENDAGVPMDAFERTYRDDNHKPELICALTPFVAKCGFRDLDQTRALFDELGTSELAELRRRLAAEGEASEVLAETLAWLLRLPEGEATVLVRATVAAAARMAEPGPFHEPFRWTATINAEFPDDIGVVVALLLNHVVLKPGEAVYLDAGNLHAYLRGVGVEIMANSDNVVRGGLTPKNIDVEELLVVLDCSPINPPVQAPTKGRHRFDAPVPDFSLTRVDLAATPQPVGSGPAIVVVTEGDATLSTPNDSLSARQGEVFFVTAEDGTLAVSGDGVLFVAGVGD